MFVLDELDKILKKLTSPSEPYQDSGRLQINLNDIQRINVDQLHINSKVRYSIDQSLDRIFDQKLKSKKNNDLAELVAGLNHCSLNTVFASIVIRLITTKLADLPERQYPTARIIICDQASYDVLIKLNRIILKLVYNKTSSMKNFLYKAPFNVTAIFLLPDIVDICAREQAPITLNSIDPSTGRVITTYNYNLIRKIFPYLKMSDLIILYQESDKLQLGFFNPKAPREQQILQLFNHFVRSARVIELDLLNKLLGKLHPIYDNVLIIQDPTEGKEASKVFGKLSLPYLSHFAERLVQMAEMTHLAVSSVTYRSGNFGGQTRVLSQFIVASLESRRRTETKENLKCARVVVVDRFHDLTNVMFHSDRYGAFLEQEKQNHGSEESITRLKLDTLDLLDEKLQLRPLTEVLSTILRYAMNWKSLKPNQLEVQSLSSTLSKSSSIERHLELVKIVYKCLNEGYLLMLRIESSLEDIMKQLSDPTVESTKDFQEQLAEKLSRVCSAFSQLAKLSGVSIRLSDLLRIACILTNIMNIFLSHLTQSSHSNVTSNILNDLRATIFSNKEFKKLIKLKQDGHNEEKMDLSTFFNKLNSFDRLSKEYCHQKPTLSLIQIVEKFQNQQLDSTTFSTISLLDAQNQLLNEENIIVAFLGALTPNEISKIKSFEATLKHFKTGSSIYIITSKLAEPEIFLMAL